MMTCTDDVLPLPNYPFNVYEVEDCPPNKDQWEIASERLHCSTDNTNKYRYHCLPNSNHTKLVEFCLNSTRYGTPPIDGEFDCYVLSGTGDLNRYTCMNASNGCPDSFYFSDEIYKYPDCFLINKTSDGAISTCTDSSDSQETFQIAVTCVTAVIFVIVLLISVICFLGRRRKKGKQGRGKQEKIEIDEDEETREKLMQGDKKNIEGNNVTLTPSPCLELKTSKFKKKEDAIKNTDTDETNKKILDDTDTCTVNKTGVASSQETKEKFVATVDIHTEGRKEQNAASSSIYSNFQWAASLGATSAKIIQPTGRHIEVNFKDTIILLAEIKSIVEVEHVVWQKRKENDDWENLNILDEKYKGSRADLYVPCLIIHNCGSEVSGDYRLFVETSEKSVTSRERSISVFTGKESAPLEGKIEVLKGIAQFLVLLTMRTFVSCRIKGRFVDHLKSVMSSIENKLVDEEKEALKKVLNGTCKLEDLSFWTLYKLLQFGLQIDPPAKGWNVNPENNKSLSDDLERCHQYLEQIKSPHISYEKMSLMWNTLSEALHRIIREWEEIHLIVNAFRKMVYWTTNSNTTTVFMPENILVQNRTLIEGWIEDDLLFEETRASKRAKEAITSKPISIFIGGRGSGKTFLARHIALEYQLKGWEVVSVSSPEEIRRYGNMDKKQMFIQDDAFGVYGIDQAAINKFETWKEAVLNILKKGSKYIITCRKTIFLASEIKSNLDEYKFDLESDEHCLTEDERKRLFVRHCEEKKVKESVYKDVQLPPPPFMHMFPLLCHLFASVPQDVSFFNNPCTHLLEEFGMMYERDCKKVDYTSLVLCAVNEGSISMENFPDNDIRNDILDSCGCNLGTSKREVIDSLGRMLGTYTIKVGEQISFLHDAIGEVAVCHFGKNNVIQVLKHFSITYIVNNVSFSKKPEEDLKFFMEERHFDLLAERIMDDIIKGKLYEIFTSNVFDYDKFRTIFVEKVKCMDMPKFMRTFIEKIPEDPSFKEKIDLVTSKAEVHKASENRKHLLIQDTYVENQSENRSIKTISWLVYYAHIEILQAVINRAKDGVLNLLIGTSSEEDARLLILACYRGRKEILQFLLPYCQENSKNISPLKSNTSDTNFHRFLTPLTAAASLGETDLLQCMVDLKTTAGGNLNSTDGWGDTPLMAAVRENKLETVKFLIEKLNADINFQASDEVTALYIASEKGHEEIVDYLCTKNALITDKKSPIHVAYKNKHYNIIQKLEEQKVKF